MRSPAARSALAAATAAFVVGVVFLAAYTPGSAKTVTSLDTVTSTVVSTASATVTETVTSVGTVTVVVPSDVMQTTTLTGTSTSVSCTISGEGGPLFIQVETDQGTPVPGQMLKVLHMGPTVDGQYCGTVELPPLYTNSTGWVEVPGDTLPYAGSYAVSFAYSGQSYNATALIQPVTTTYLSVGVPSGHVYTTNCQFNSCPTMSDSMMGG